MAHHTHQYITYNENGLDGHSRVWNLEKTSKEAQHNNLLPAYNWESAGESIFSMSYSITLAVEACIYGMYGKP